VKRSAISLGASNADEKKYDGVPRELLKRKVREVTGDDAP